MAIRFLIIITILFCFVFPCVMHICTVSGMFSILLLESQLESEHHHPLLDCFCLFFLSWRFVLILLLHGKVLPWLLVTVNIELDTLISTLKTPVFLYVFLIYLGKWHLFLRRYSGVLINGIKSKSIYQVGYVIKEEVKQLADQSDLYFSEETFLKRFPFLGFVHLIQTTKVDL